MIMSHISDTLIYEMCNIYMPLPWHPRSVWIFPLILNQQRVWQYREMEISVAWPIFTQETKERLYGTTTLIIYKMGDPNCGNS